VRLLAKRAALREDSAALLGELGGTAAEVAVSLTAMGVRVWPASSGDCPLARYLHAVMGPDPRVKRVKVTTRWLALTTRGTWWSTVWLRLPHPVREFVAAGAPAPDDDGTDVPSAGNQA
jgi:hypothetical protein